MAFRQVGASNALRPDRCPAFHLHPAYTIVCVSLGFTQDFRKLEVVGLGLMVLFVNWAYFIIGGNVSAAGFGVVILPPCFTMQVIILLQHAHTTLKKQRAGNNNPEGVKKACCFTQDGDLDAKRVAKILGTMTSVFFALTFVGTLTGSAWTCCMPYPFDAKVKQCCQIDVRTCPADLNN